jgi:hypothetical protein
MWLAWIASALAQSNRETETIELTVGQVSNRQAQTCDDPKVATVDVTAGGKNNVTAVGVGETMCGSVDVYRRAGDRIYFKVVVKPAPTRTLGEGDVAAHRLQPMRAKGIEPKLWHDESAGHDGSVACAVTDTEVVRLDGDALTRIAFDKIGSVDFKGTEVQGGWLTVTAMDGAAVRCHFAANEGSAKFVETLNYEAAVH